MALARDDFDLDELNRLVAGEGLRSVYQPIVDLDSGETVAFEALARGPVGSRYESPGAMFDAAREVGLVSQLDWACKTVAVRTAVAQRLAPPLALFVNSEPEAAGALMPAEFAANWAQAKHSYLPLVFEITERAVASRPADLLHTVMFLKSLGWGVALDDVGADAQSMALLPFIQPEVIKLDMRAVQDFDPDLVEVVVGVNAEVERSGALILAEGIETEEQLERARTLGATLGQGWLFGKPADLPDNPVPPSGRPLRIDPRPAATSSGSPFEKLAAHVTPRRITRRDLDAISAVLERRALSLPFPPVMLSAFQDVSRFEPQREVYTQLSRRLPFLVVFAQGMDPEPIPGVKGVHLDKGDPLADEWLVGGLSPFQGFFLAAREVADGAGKFEYILTFDRNLVIEASLLLLTEITEGSAAGPGIDGLVEFATVITDAVSSAASDDEVVRPILETMARLTGLESTFLAHIANDEFLMARVHNEGELDIIEGSQIPWVDTICKSALDAGRDNFEDAQVELPHAPAAFDLGIRRFVTCPVILDDGRVVGTLCGASGEAGGFTEDQVEMVRTFAEVVRRRLSTGKTTAE